MDKETYMEFYKNTILGYSVKLQSYICSLLVKEKLITFEEQRSIFDKVEPLYFKSKKDYRGIITSTTTDTKCIKFYERWEFIKLYKYSVPLFYTIEDDKALVDKLNDKKFVMFKQDTYEPEYIISTSFKNIKPIFMVEKNNLFIKFVLQKSYPTPETFERIDYRYPIIAYFNIEENYLEIRYDSTKYNNSLNSDVYEGMVCDCIEWLKSELNIKLFTCEHANMIELINKGNDKVKMYKQMMEMGAGASAELTASENKDYVIPFIGEIRELIEENEDLFNEALEVKQLLLQYLLDKEETASYPYIYVKWVNPVESQSYLVKVTFDYLNHKYTLLQHITGSCKDLEMGRMNDAIEYLCKSGSFIKGDEI